MIYLLHFEKPVYGSVQHYIGFTDDIEQRLKTHQSGVGSRLTGKAKKLGIRFVLAKTWPGDKKEERRIKRLTQGKKQCPVCTFSLPRKQKGNLR